MGKYNNIEEVRKELNKEIEFGRCGVAFRVYNLEENVWYKPIKWGKKGIIKKFEELPLNLKQRLNIIRDCVNHGDKTYIKELEING